MTTKQLSQKVFAEKLYAILVFNLSNLCLHKEIDKYIYTCTYLIYSMIFMYNE